MIGVPNDPDLPDTAWALMFNEQRPVPYAREYVLKSHVDALLKANMRVSVREVDEG